MTTVGDKLRKERLRQGLDLESLARDTRINSKYLQAIEADDPTSVPGGFFYRSFVRQYALALGLNATELDAELERARAAEAPVLTAALKSAQFPIKEPDPIVRATNRRVAAGRLGAYVALLIGVMAGCSAFYMWWKQIENPKPEAQTAAADARQVMTPASRQGAAPATAQPQQLNVDISQRGADDRVVVAVSARETTWLAITSDGKTVFSGILEPSQTKVLGGKDRAYIKVGNAGGLEVTWNGKPIGPIGERGQVKTILFTPESFRIQPAAGQL